MPAIDSTSVTTLNKIFHELHLVQNKPYLWLIVINIVISIISLFWNLLLQVKLKEKDKEINSHNLRESCRIRVLEDAFRKMNKLAQYSKTHNSLLLNEYTDFTTFIQENKIYINKKTEKLLIQYRDYISSVIGNVKNIDYKKENDYFDKFVNYFNEYK